MSFRLALLVSLLTFAGCGEPPETASAHPREQAPVAVGATESSAAVPEKGPGAGAGSNEAQLAAVLVELTQAVRRYGLEQRRAPKSLEDVVAAGYLSALPEAPEGKRFVIGKNLDVQLLHR